MARERCVVKTAQYGRLFEPGEIRTITRFNQEGDPIVSEHFRLVEDYEEVDPRDVYSDEELEAKRRESASLDKTAAILSALQKLDARDDGDWTSSGLPSVQRVHLLAGVEVQRSDIIAAAPDFDRKSWAEVQEAQSASS